MLIAKGWRGQLDLRYWREAAKDEAVNAEPPRTLTHDRHDGPLRVLAPLYPEGPAICHHTLVHPPSGIVGGDVLTLNLQVEANAHAVITTPGATRFYATRAEAASQHCHLSLDDGARLEWLPLEAIAYPGCEAQNKVSLRLAPSAQMMGWDLLALGLPASAEPFDRGCFEQSIEWNDLPTSRRVWLERGVLDTRDPTFARWRTSPLGLDQRDALGVMWFAAGSPLSTELREGLVDAARTAIPPDVAAVTCPNPQLVTVRALAPSVEPALEAFKAVWAAWRPLAWGLAATAPRIWRL